MRNGSRKSVRYNSASRCIRNDQIGCQGGLVDTAFGALVMVTLKAIGSPKCGSVPAWSALPPPMFVEATLGAGLAPAASGLER